MQVQGQNFRSAYSTVEEITRETPFDVISGDGILEEAKRKLDLKSDTSAVGVSLTGSNVLVSASNGQSVQTVRLNSGSQANDLDVAYQIIGTVAKAAKDVVSVFFSIAGMPTESETAQRFAKTNNFDMRKLEGLYYLVNFNNGSLKEGYETHDAKTAEHPANHYVDMTVGLKKELVTDSNGVKPKIQLSDENGSRIVHRASTQGTEKLVHTEVSNDTVTAAKTAAIIERASGYEVKKADAIVLGTGTNKGQIEEVTDTNNSVVTEKAINEESGHALVPKEHFGPLDRYITPARFQQPLTIENLFAGGNDKKTDVNDLRGIRLGLHCFRDALSGHSKLETRREMVRDLIDNLNSDLSSTGCRITDTINTVCNKLGVTDDTVALPSNQALTLAAKKSGSLEHALVVDKYKRMAAVYKARDGADHYNNLDLLAVTGSIIVDDFINVPKARKVFCETLGIPESKLFIHRFKGDDGMSSMVKILASTAPETRIKMAQARLTAMAS